MFSYAKVHLYIEKMFQELDLARSAMFEANIHAGSGKDALVEAKLNDAEKHIKALNTLQSDMKIEMARIRDSQN